MGTTWRLIRDGDHDAATNMGIDEAVMSAHALGGCPPTLRLYGWERPSISLGYFQDLSRGGIDLGYCEEAGIELVRRPTGGRAVLHGHDLTFSIVIAETGIPSESRSVLGSHAWLMGGIVEAFRLLGVDARLGGVTGAASMKSADCFAHAAACDIVAGTHKVAGSAQVRRRGVILEQGSIPFRRPEIEPQRVFRRQTEVCCRLPEGLDRKTLEDTIILGFRESQGIEMLEDRLSADEMDSARNLAATRFSDRERTLRIR